VLALDDVPVSAFVRDAVEGWAVLDLRFTGLPQVLQLHRTLRAGHQLVGLLGPRGAGAAVQREIGHDVDRVTMHASGTRDSRFQVEVATTSGRAAMVAFRVLDDRVEVWHQDRCAAVFQRDDLRAWLREPVGRLSMDDVQLTLDRTVDVRGRVALTLPDVSAWTLFPTTLSYLEVLV